MNPTNSPRHDGDSVTRNEVFASIVTEAGAYYKLTVAVATSFLGGTLLFMEGIAPNPTACSLVFLAIGWVLLITSIVLVVFVRALNLKAGQFALENRIPEAQRLDSIKWKLTIWSACVLACGLGCIMLFGFLNIV